MSCRLWPAGCPGISWRRRIAFWLVLMGRTDEAQTELDRILPAVLAGSGPRQLGAAAGLAFVATQSGDDAAAAQLREALLPYRGRLALFGGAGMCLGPVSLFTGPAGHPARAARRGGAVAQQAIAFAEGAGALPCLALSLQAASRALSLRQAPGDRERASAYRARARAIAARLGMSGAQPAGRRPGRLEPAARRRGLAAAAGAEHARLRDSRGLHYLRALLAAPGSDIPALDLAAGGPGLPPRTQGRC